MSNSQKSINWLLALIILLLGATVLSINLIYTEMQQNMILRSYAIIGATLIALGIWLLFFSRMSWRLRLGIFVPIIAVIAIFNALFRIKNVTGDFYLVFEYRWKSEKIEKKTAEQAPTINTEIPQISATDYPQFLGHNRDATIGGVSLVSDWATNPPKVVWRRPIGEAWSAFAIVGDYAVTQEQEGENELVTCYDMKTGKLKWVYSYPGRYASTIAGVGPRATPTVTADGYVYTLGATGVLNCLHLVTGDLLWSKDTLEDNGAKMSKWGNSSSPLVVGDLVVISAGGAANRSLVAYHKNTGEFVWGSGDEESGYASPMLATLANVPQILIFNSHHVFSHDPNDGNILWKYAWRKGQPNVAQPLVLPADQVLLSTGYGVGSHLLQIDRDAQGKFSAKKLWRSPRLKAKFTNIVYRNGYIYGLSDGTLTCIDTKKGKRIWRGKSYGHGQLLLVKDKLLIQAENGHLVLVAAEPEFKEYTTIPVLNGKTCWNSPAFSPPYLLIRNNLEAVCLEMPLEN